MICGPCYSDIDFHVDNHKYHTMNMNDLSLAKDDSLMEEPALDDTAEREDAAAEDGNRIVEDAAAAMEDDNAVSDDAVSTMDDDNADNDDAIIEGIIAADTNDG